MNRILGVSPILEQLEQIKDTVESELMNIAFDFASNEEKAKEKLLKNTYHLVITSLSIPKDGKTILDERLYCGLDLIQWMENKGMNIPSILIKKTDDVNLDREVNRLKQSELLNDKTGWEDLLIKRVRQYLNATPTIEPRKLNVDIFLYLDKQKAEYSLQGVGFPCNIERIPLDIPGRELLELVSESEALEQNIKGSGGWQKKLQGIGELLMRHIFERDYTFRHLMTEQVTLAGGLSNTRIRFIVEEQVHPIALEAIYGPEEHIEKDYWMLHAPIYRTIGKSGGWGFPLFYDQNTREGPLNILIIKSPTETKEEKPIVIDGTRIHLKHLENVETECKFLKNYFADREHALFPKIAKIETIPYPDDPRSFYDQVKETLENSKTPWHIVHYVGHSYFDHDTMKGYLFFPNGFDENNEQLIKELGLDEFSAWLQSAKPNLVFVSSCHSSESGFVFELARRRVPAIIGFRWDIEDDMANEYTQAFYKMLFGGKTESLEYVFLKTRQDIYKRYKNNPIWAAPILVMQIPSR